MKRFLQKLASSVIRPQPTIRPFVESIYPAPLHASQRLTKASEMSLASSRREQPALQPVPVIPAETFSAARPPHMEVQQWLSTTKLSAQPENISTHEQNYFRPLLAAREIEESHDAGVVAPLPQTESTPPSASDSRSGRTQDDERDSDASPKFPVRATRPEQEETRGAKQVSPFLPLFEAQSLLASRRTVAATQFAACAQQETHTGDDIRINIGRIEVIAVPPSPPHAALAPTRKGMSLDEYLSRRNGRVG